MNNHRSEYIAGLRAIADLLDSKPDLPIPSTPTFHWYLFGSPALPTQKAEAARIVRLIGGKHTKYETGDLYRFASRVHGIKTEVIVDRPAVCERVVVAADVVTRRVPDPSAPLIEITETVEQVEWVCLPLLAEDEAVA